MRTWLRAVVATPGAADDLKQNIEEMIRVEDSIGKVQDLAQLHNQRGKVEGLQKVLSLLSHAKTERSN